MALKSLAPLRHRPFALFWSGAFVSNIGTWMETVTIGFYVTKITGQATWTGAVAAAGFVPVAVLGPIGGALADRLSRKHLLLATTLAQTGFAGLLTALFVAGSPSAPLVTLIVFGSGIASAIGFPAYQALLPDLVPTEDLPGAIGLSSAQWNLGRVIGPLVAGIVIHVGSYSWALAVNTASFLAVVAVLLVLTLPTPPPHLRDEPLLRSVIDGFRFVRAEAGLRVNLAAMCVTTFVAAPFIALVPAMAVKVLDADSRGTSLLVTAQGVGAVAMGVALGSLAARFGVRRTLVGVLTLMPPALVAYAYAPNLTLSAFAIFFVGATYLGALSSYSTIAQLRAPAHLRGRVLSVNNVVLGSCYPLGAVLQGALADRIGLRHTTAISAGLLASVLLGARLLRPRITEAVELPLADATA